MSSEPITLADMEAQTVRLVEEYDSFESAMFYGKNYAEFRIRLDELRIVTKRTICGDISDEAKAALDLFQPEYFQRI